MLFTKIFHNAIKYRQRYLSPSLRNVQAFTSIIKIDGVEKIYVSYYDNTEEKRATKELKDMILQS